MKELTDSEMKRNLSQIPKEYLTKLENNNWYSVPNSYFRLWEDVRYTIERRAERELHRKQIERRLNEEVKK